MAMETRIEVGMLVRVDETADEMWRRNSYRGKWNKGDVAEVTNIHRWGKAFNLGDEDGPPHYIKPESVTVLEGQNMNGGCEMDDVVTIGEKWVATESNSMFTKGEVYTAVAPECSCCAWAFRNTFGDIRTYRDEDFPTMAKVADAPEADAITDTIFDDGAVPESPVAEVIELPKRALTPFGELSDEDKGALLLAHYNGDALQYWVDDEWVNLDWEPMWLNDSIYRVKPQALIELENKMISLDASVDAAQMTLTDAQNAFEKVEKEVAAFNKAA